MIELNENQRLFAELIRRYDEMGARLAVAEREAEELRQFVRECQALAPHGIKEALREAYKTPEAYTEGRGLEARSSRGTSAVNDARTGEPRG